MGGAFMTQMGGTVMANLVPAFWEICSKKHWPSGEYPSSHRMFMGFSPFELPIVTHGQLQKGPRLRLALSEEPSSRLAFTELQIFQLLSELGVGLNGWS